MTSMVKAWLSTDWNSTWRAPGVSNQTCRFPFPGLPGTVEDLLDPMRATVSLALGVYKELGTRLPNNVVGRHVGLAIGCGDPVHKASRLGRPEA